MPIIRDTYDQLFMMKAQKYAVPFTWVKAVAGVESDYNPNAYREEPQINDASRGLMQVLFKTAVALGFEGSPNDLYDPEISVEYGTKLLSQNINRFGMVFEKVYSAYNSGSPTAYLTSSQVKRNVERAVSYLEAVEAHEAAKQGQAPGEESLEPG